MITFKQYIKLLEQNMPGTHNDFATLALLPSDWTGSEMPNINLPFLPSLDMQIPTTTRTSIITNIIKNTNPIAIELKDGTKLYLSIDEFKRINKEPCIGNNMTVVFQRNATDFSENPSKIIKLNIN